MDNGTKIFDFEGKTTRLVEVNNEIWFAARDVADILGYLHYSPTTIFKHVPDKWKGVNRIATPGGPQNLLCISEEGLYFFLNRSDKPKARPYQMWIAGEVVPSIRRCGMYMTDQTFEAAINDPDRLIAIVEAYRKEYNRRKQLEATLEHARPNIVYAKAVEAHGDTVTVAEFAKFLTQNGYVIGPNGFYGDLRRDGYICKNRFGRNEPTQQAMISGLFRMSVDIVTDENGKEHVEHVPRLTQHGQKVFTRRYLYGILDDWNE